MAENKKSFILYADLIATVSKLPDNKAGKLFKTVLEYVNDMKPTVDDILVQVAFEPIKQQLKRDLAEWDKQKQSRSEAGKKGMATRWNNKQITKITKHNSVINPITKITDTVTVNVTDTVNVKKEGGGSEVFYDGEELILKNTPWLEAVLMKRGFSMEEGLVCLRKFHLHKQEKEGYPATKKAVFAGFEKWLMNERQFNPSKELKACAPPIDPQNKW